MEQFPDNELENAEILINEDQCLCTDGGKNRFCEKCPFRKGVKEQIGRESFELPTVHVRDGIHCSSVNDVILENYQSHPKIYFPLSN